MSRFLDALMSDANPSPPEGDANRRTSGQVGSTTGV